VSALVIAGVEVVEGLPDIVLGAQRVRVVSLVRAMVRAGITLWP